MSYEWHDFVGNVGVAIILFTYLALQLGRTTGTTFGYAAANGAGAVLILVSLSQDFNLSSFIIEVCWLAISLVGMVKAIAGTRNAAP